jgi:sugar-phosphatase
MDRLVIPGEGILFDCDGVLVDSLDSAATAWDRWAATYAPDFDFRTQIQHGMRAADTIATLVTAEVLNEAVAALDAEEIASASGTAGIPGATALTASLPTERWAVVTSATRGLAKARLLAAGHPEPRAVISAEDVTRGKPDPEPYLLGARRIGVDVNRCVVFEDASAGVMAARTAGVGYVIGVGDHLEGALVDAHIDDLRDVRYENGELHVYLDR